MSMSTSVSEFKRERAHSTVRETDVSPLADMLSDIRERQGEFLKIQRNLHCQAKHASRISKYLRIAIIILGAFAATRDIAGNRPAVVALYTIMALAITVIGSIAAAFGFADRASGLNVLAAECNTHVLKVDCEMPREAEASGTRHLSEARRLISYQNEKLGDIQAKAAKLGVLVPGVQLDSTRPARRRAEC